MRGSNALTTPGKIPADDEWQTADGS